MVWLLSMLCVKKILPFSPSACLLGTLFCAMFFLYYWVGSTVHLNVQVLMRLLPSSQLVAELLLRDPAASSTGFWCAPCAVHIQGCVKSLLGSPSLLWSCFSDASELCVWGFLDWWQWQQCFGYNSRMSKVLPVGSWPRFLLKSDLTASMALLQGLRDTEYLSLFKIILSYSKYRYRVSYHYSKYFHFMGSPMMSYGPRLPWGHFIF